MNIKPTPSQVRSRGQLQDEYFPNCLNSSEVNALLAGLIDEVDAIVSARIQANYAKFDNTSLPEAYQLNKASVYLVLAEIMQMLISVGTSYDAERLPPELLDIDKLESLRNDYRAQAEAILKQFDADATTLGSEFIFNFRAGGEPQDD